MKILLILPRDQTYQHRKGIFRRSLRYAPLTLTTLAALVPKELNAQVEIVDEGVDVLDMQRASRVDLVGISAVTATAPRAYMLADYLRGKRVTVVLGGVHPTLMPDEALLHADSVVMGFAEESWPQLLEDFAGRGLKRSYKASADLRLDGLPLPRRELLKRSAYITTNTVQASRGCPNKCSFCTIPEVWGAQCYHRPIREVGQEIESMGARDILFLDPSLTEDKEYAKKLFQALIPLNIRWAGLSTIKVAEDKELLDLAVKSGCRGLLIGFETISQNALDQSGKHFSSVTKYKDAVARLQGLGIVVLGCFMFGFEDEDASIFKRTVDFANEIKVDILRYAVFTPFPGTKAYAALKKEGRILSDDWSLYDNEHVVFRPARMSAEELQQGLYFAWKHSYTMKSLYRRFRGMRHFHLLSLMVNLGFRYYGQQLPLRHRAR